MKDLRYMSISINTEEPGIVSSRIRNTILKRVMWIQSQVYWQKIIVGVSVSLFMYTPVVTEIICRCIFIVYNIPLFVLTYLARGNSKTRNKEDIQEIEGEGFIFSSPHSGSKRRKHGFISSKTLKKITKSTKI